MVIEKISCQLLLNFLGSNAVSALALTVVVKVKGERTFGKNPEVSPSLSKTLVL